MGILDLFKRPQAGTGEFSTLLSPSDVLSPFQAQLQLPPALIADFDIAGVAAMTRLDALRVPAISKGRALIHSIIGSRPLRAYRGAELLTGDAQPTWLYRSDSGISPINRTKSILDDIIFNEASLLAVRRGAAPTDGGLGPILDAVHVPYERWAVDREGKITVDGKPAAVGSVVWIPGPGPGLLAIASDTVAASNDMARAWQTRVRNPMPAFILQEQSEGSMTEKEAKDYVEKVAAMRRNPDGAVMFADGRIRVEAHASEATDLFESGRNALRLDVANHLNIPAALLEGSQAAATLTYSTQEGQRNELVDYTIPFWAGPIEQALSMDGVVPRGTRVAFDFTDLIAPAASPTGPTTED
jgi:hypothetical protein